ncbi:MAG: hypothetical protein WC496_12400 [Phycisphaerae bacterium]|jgi:hypothetical protein
MSLPPITFSNWVRWIDRTNINSLGSVGVYILAHYKEPPGIVDLQSQEIIYIGETCNQSFSKRWEQFHSCAFKGKENHSGGETYWKLFSGKYIEYLYVASFPVDGLSDELCPLFIRYVERKLILEYAIKWGAAPRCNHK